MAYDVSSSSGPAKRVAQQESVLKASPGKVAMIVIFLLIGGYCLTAGQMAWFPFGNDPTPPKPASDSEKKAIQAAPPTPKQDPAIQAIEALPEEKRPRKAGS